MIEVEFAKFQVEVNGALNAMRQKVEQLGSKVSQMEARLKTFDRTLDVMASNELDAMGVLKSFQENQEAMGKAFAIVVGKLRDCGALPPKGDCTR